MQIEICPCCGKPKRPKTVERPIAYPDSDCWGIPNKSGYESKETTVPIAPGDVNPGGTRSVQTFATPLARAWEGHRYGGQILKNALEPIIVAQKPWEGKRLDCIVETGAGALWVDGGRIGYEHGGSLASNPSLRSEIAGGCGGHIIAHEEERRFSHPHNQGRWPANFVLCHSEGCERVGVKKVKGTNISYDRGNIQCQNEVAVPPTLRGQNPLNYCDPDGYERVDEWQCVEGCPVAKLDEQAGERRGGNHVRQSRGNEAEGNEHTAYGKFGASVTKGYDETGGASRFFYQADWSHEVAERIADTDPVRYCPKAARTERSQGLDDFYWRKDKKAPIGFVRIDKDEWETLPEKERAQGNIHPTCKPISLNVWLAKLLSPPKEYAPRRILIPFCGTMSEGIGALLAGWEEIVGIDSEQDYCDIGEARMEFWVNKPKQLELS